MAGTLGTKALVPIRASAWTTVLLLVTFAAFALSAPPPEANLVLINPRQLPPSPQVDPSTVTPKGLISVNLPVLATADAVSSFTQQVIDVLTCRGVGGLALLLSSQKRPEVNSTERPDTSQPRFIIPPGVISFTNEGHKYEVDAQAAVGKLGEGLVAVGNVVNINGHTAITVAAFLAVHVSFGIFVFLNILPTALGLESTRNILYRIKFSHVLPNIPRWNSIMWLAVIAPSIPIVFIFGVLIMGDSGHFRTSHGVFGLITLIFGIVAVGLHLTVKVIPADEAAVNPRLRKFRDIVNQLFLLFASLAALTGFTDLSQITICLTQVIPIELALTTGFGLGGVFILGSSIGGLDSFLAFKERRRQKKRDARKESEGSFQAFDFSFNARPPTNSSPRATV